MLHKGWYEYSTSRCAGQYCSKTRLPQPSCPSLLAALRFALTFSTAWGEGRDSLAAVWLAAGLWAAAALSESRLVSQPTLAVAAWTALFTLPPAYAVCRCDCTFN